MSSDGTIVGGISPTRCDRATGFSDSRKTGGEERVSNWKMYVELKARPVTEWLRPVGVKPCRTISSARLSRSCFKRLAVSCSSWTISASMAGIEPTNRPCVRKWTEGNSACHNLEGLPCKTNSCQAETFQIGP